MSEGRHDDVGPDSTYAVFRRDELDIAGLVTKPGPLRRVQAKEASAYVGISAKTLNRMRVRGKGPRYTNRGRRVIYDVVDLDEWMEEGKTPPHE